MFQTLIILSKHGFLAKDREGLGIVAGIKSKVIVTKLEVVVSSEIKLLISELQLSDLSH